MATKEQSQTLIAHAYVSFPRFSMADKNVVLPSGQRLSDLRVTDLKEELQKRKLPARGNKAELASRLREVRMD